MATDVLLVMKKPGNLRITEQMLGRHDICAHGIREMAELAPLLDSGFTPDLALVDVSGFGPDVWPICAELQRREMPFIVLFQPNETALSSQSLQYGAMSLLQKPVAKSALLQLVQGMTR